MKKQLCLLCILFLSRLLSAQESIDLSGKWGFQIDRNDKGITEKWYNHPLDDRINLPGSMPEKLKGDLPSVKTQWTGSLYDSSFYYNPELEMFRRTENLKLPFFLTPVRHYVGVAWYQREIHIPSSWKGKRIMLFLERPHIETTVWVNNQRIGSQNSLTTPHEYDITSAIKPGKSTLTLRINNDEKCAKVGLNSHSITDHTQGNWNGVVGRMLLYAVPDTHFEDIQVYPEPDKQQARVRVVVQGQKGSVKLALKAESFNSETHHQVPEITQTFSKKQLSDTLEMVLPMGKDVQLWDEFHPALYRLTATLTQGKQTEQRDVEFGMRTFTIQGRWFYVNGRKVMLRGTVENCDFPLTGYPPMDEESWERVFRICRNYGLNHMRFHSYCPPEAAFKAADRVGFYLQPEGPSWPNHDVRLGQGQYIDHYLMDETIRMSKWYGNHASFCMLACGNEPSGNWVPWVSNFVDFWKAYDTRRVYTGASVGGGWAWQPKSQYHVKAGVRGLEWNKQRPETLTDFRERIDTVKQPFVSHETGQWCVFPNFNEIQKYTGVNKAGNLEIFQYLLDAHGMKNKGHDFMMASGKLQALCYKHEIERTLRTPDYAGFQLLALNDYSGQGTALVGILDVFFEEKGYINAAQWRRFCSPTVPLIRTEKFVYTTNETFHAGVEVSHFGEKPLNDAKVTYRITDAYGKVYVQNVLGRFDIPIGNLNSTGEINFPLKDIPHAMKLNVEVRIEGTDAVNDWDFWVYPEKVDIETGEVYQTDSLDSKALNVLEQGGKVLITAGRKVSYGKEVVQYFTPVFWNTSWFKMRPPHTTGILTNPHHPLFREFPTEYHSNLQWWELLNRAPVMQFTDFDESFQPLIQSIDTWFISRKIGVLFEANVLNGKLIMTTLDLDSEPDKRIVARQLKKSVLDYMNSDSFHPTYRADVKQIQELFTKVAGSPMLYTKDSPDELKPKLK